MKGRLYILSGPSGAGKGTVCKRLLEEMPEIVLSISMTTRRPRNDEQDGVSYFFTDKETFLKVKEEGGLLECAQHFDNYYGTPRHFVMDNLNAGKDVMLEIEPVGALQVKAKLPESVLIFLTVRSKQVLIDRLKKRGSETEESIAERMKKAEMEMNQKEKYDYVVLNDEVENAVAQIKEIIRRDKEQ